MFALGLALACGGCASQVDRRTALTRRASIDLRCPPDRITVDARSGQADGCRRHAVYRVICEPGCGWILAEPVR